MMDVTARFLLVGALLIGVAAPLQGQDDSNRQRDRSAWLGISLDRSDDSASGVRIAGVAEGTPADDADIRSGDRITMWNGRPDVSAAIREASLQVGDTVHLRVARSGSADRNLSLVAAPRTEVVERIRRDGREIIVLRPGAVFRDIDIDFDSLAVHIDSIQSQMRVLLRDSLDVHIERIRENMPRIEIIRDDLHDLGGDLAGLGLRLTASRTGLAGAEFAEIVPGLGQYFGTESGVLVLRVAPGTLAEEAGLRAGDVIVSADGEPIDELADLREAIGEVVVRRRNADREPMEVGVVRNGRRLDLSVER